MAARRPTPKSNDDSPKPGAQAEALAERFLIRKGLKLIQRNFRCRGGEIDLIMQDASGLVFVEVRLRTNRTFAGAAESVAARKQQRVILAAQHYLATLGAIPRCRFDVIAMDALDAARIEWIRDAFQT
ncbi:MAG: YraN family protein [Burkholderiales bacterium]|nr:YraN family protein [Burkholderiales bacterium]